MPHADGQQRTKLETAGLLNMVLSAAGWQTIYTDGAGHKRFVFGGHAARVAGATFLALRGVPVAIMQLIGRWSSTAVEIEVHPAGAVGSGAGHPGTGAGRRRFVTPRRQPLRTSRPRLWTSPPSFVPAPVSAEKAVPAATTTHYVMNCRTRLLHKPAAEEAETERAEWQARYGWPYGVRQFYRLHDLPPNPSLCRRCTPVDLEAPEAVSSSDSSSSTSGATSESD